MRYFLLLPLLLMSIVWGGQAQATTLTLDPATGVILGHPGDPIGWGFTLNNPTGYLVPTAVETHPTSTDPSLYTPVLGSFVDLIAMQYFEVGPADTFQENYNRSSGMGLGSFTINSTAAPGTSESFTFWLFYDLYDDSPSIAGGNSISYGNYVTADATIKVDDTNINPIPEPSAIILVAGGLLGAAVMRNRKGVRD